MLEVNLKLIWSCGVYETKDQTISNRNMRYSAYRSLNLWLNTKKKSGRVSLPSCIVNFVRDTYPDVNNEYTGYIKSPIFTKKRLKKK